MSFTMRERMGALKLVFLWLLITGFAVATGPFGTFELMELPLRSAYWAVIVGVSILLTRLQQRMLRAKREGWRLLAQLPYAILLACLAHGMNLWIFPGWGGWQDFGFLLAVTLSVVLLVEIAVFVLRNYFLQPAPQADPPSEQMLSDETNPAQSEVDPQANFLRRLPLEKRAALVRLEAQDHYLLVVTAKGSETLLLRMADAEAELEGAGLRVHRSHWVAPAGVTRHLRQKGRDFLVTQDGSEIPVSRSYRPAVQEAGLIT